MNKSFELVGLIETLSEIQREISDEFKGSNTAIEAIEQVKLRLAEAADLVTELEDLKDEEEEREND